MSNLVLGTVGVGSTGLTGIGATTNYRGGIWVDDDGSGDRDFNDLGLMCHSLEYTGAGAGARITGLKFENNGTFRGQLVTPASEQNGVIGNPFSFSLDTSIASPAGNAAGSSGGIATWDFMRKIKDLYYEYRLPVLNITTYDWDTTLTKGKFAFNNSGNVMNRLLLSKYDKYGNDIGSTFYINPTDSSSKIGSGSNQGGKGSPEHWCFKITSMNKDTTLYPYSISHLTKRNGGSSSKWIMGRIIQDDNNGEVYNSGTDNERVEYRVDILAGNINLLPVSGDRTYPFPDNAEDFGNDVQIEWFKPDNVNVDYEYMGNNLKFCMLRDGGTNNRYQFITQRVVNNSWTFWRVLFEASECDNGTNAKSGDVGFTNAERYILPNVKYDVWGLDPYDVVILGATIPRISKWKLIDYSSRFKLFWN